MFPCVSECDISGRRQHTFLLLVKYELIGVEVACTWAAGLASARGRATMSRVVVVVGAVGPRYKAVGVSFGRKVSDSM